VRDHDPSGSQTTVTIPRAERRRRRGLRRFLAALVAIAALAAAAWGGWNYLLPHHATVPQVAGRSVDEARALLTDDGFTVRVAKGVYSLKVPAGSVIKVDPVPGTTLSRGSVVTIVPSLGAQPIPVPDVGGATVDQATKILQRAGFSVGDQQQKFSDTIDTGKVIGTIPALGQDAPEQSAITLVVSKGPAPKPIPKVVGRDVKRATSALQTLGFTVKIERKFSSSIDIDVVMAVDPTEGTKSPYGSVATLTVSKGPRSFACPDFRGMSLSEARALAASHGLLVSALPVPGSSGTTVVSQIPNPGDTVHYGTTITLYYA